MGEPTHVEPANKLLAGENTRPAKPVAATRTDQRGPGAGALSLSGLIAQAKLAVGPADDPYETEADAVADRVVRSLGGRTGSRAVDAEAAPSVRRIQRRATAIGAAGGTLDADTDRAIRSSRGGGRAMPDEARRQMEGAFGADFGRIRVHEGAQATELNNRIQAKAFTVGNDLFFRDGMPDTSSRDGQHLLAHELTHTIQQGGAARQAGAAQRSIAVGRIRPARAFVQRRTTQALTNLKKFKRIETPGVSGAAATITMQEDGTIAAGASIEVETKGGTDAQARMTGANLQVTSATNNLEAAKIEAGRAARRLERRQQAAASADRKLARSKRSDKSKLEAAADEAKQAVRSAERHATRKQDTAKAKAAALEAATLAAFRAKHARRTAGRAAVADASGGRTAETVGGVVYQPLLSHRGHYIRASDLMADVGATPDPTEDGLTGVELTKGVVDAGGVTGSIGGAKENFYSSNDLVSDAGAAKSLTQTGNAVTMGSSILTLAAGILRIKKAAQSGETGAWAEGAQGVSEIGQAVASTGSAIASTVDQAGDLSKNLKQSRIDSGAATSNSHVLSDAGKASAGLAGFADIFSGLKATFSLVKNAIDIYQKNKEPNGFASRTKHEKFKEAMGIITNILEMASSGVSAAKNFLDAFSTGAGPALGAAVPGFGIALGAAELIVRGVAGIKAAIQHHIMRTDKQSTKTTFDPGDEPAVRALFPSGSVKGEQGKKWPLYQKYKELTRKQDSGAVLEQKEADFVAWGDTSEELQGYILSKGIQYVNAKRGRRAVLKIGVAMTKIAGDVATLGGASAPVGVGLKAGAALLDVGCTGFRLFKQWARNKAASSDSDSFSRKVFNTNKTSEKKLAGYNRDVDRIFDMVVKLSTTTPTISPEWAGQKERLDRVLHAIGLHPRRLENLKDDPNKLRKELIAKLQERE